eukprot:2704018-Amphidinium_carterae.1
MSGTHRLGAHSFRALSQSGIESQVLKIALLARFLLSLVLALKRTTAKPAPLHPQQEAAVFSLLVIENLLSTCCRAAVPMTSHLDRDWGPPAQHGSLCMGPKLHKCSYCCISRVVSVEADSMGQFKLEPKRASFMF